MMAASRPSCSVARTEAVAQRRRQSRLQIARQKDLRFRLYDRRVLGIAEMTVPSSRACGTDVWNSSDLDSALHLALESSKRLASSMAALGISITAAPVEYHLNQKFSTPAQSA